MEHVPYNNHDDYHDHYDDPNFHQFYNSACPACAYGTPVDRDAATNDLRARGVRGVHADRTTLPGTGGSGGILGHGVVWVTRHSA